MSTPTCARVVTSVRCRSCEVLYINGVKCHELGCPDAWQDSQRECKWCGAEFVPSEPRQTCCDEDCMRAYIS